MSGAQLFIREDLGLTDEQVEVLAGSMNVYMLVSILAAGWTVSIKHDNTSTVSWT
jgi:hypothetical protein